MSRMCYVVGFFWSREPYCQALTPFYSEFLLLVKVLTKASQTTQKTPFTSLWRWSGQSGNEHVNVLEFSGASRVSPLKWRGTFGGIMEVKWSFWTQTGGSKSAIYISILPYIAPIMKQIHLFANKLDQSNIYDYELVFILTRSSLLIIAEW